MKVERLRGPASLRRLHQLAFSKQCGLPLTAWRPVKEAVSGGTVVACGSCLQDVYTTSGSDLLKNSGADSFDIAAQGLGAWYCTTQKSPKHPNRNAASRMFCAKTCGLLCQVADCAPASMDEKLFELSFTFLYIPLRSFTSSL